MTLDLDYATYIAGLPKVLAGAAMLFSDARGHLLLLETTYRQDGKWTLPGGTIESDDGETPRDGARRETLEEIGLDIEPGPLLALDWAQGPARPPLVAYVYDGGVLDADQLAAVRLQAEELSAWRLVPVDEIEPYLSPELLRRIHGALAARAAGAGPAELENGYAVGGRPTA